MKKLLITLALVSTLGACSNTVNSTTGFHNPDITPGSSANSPEAGGGGGDSGSDGGGTG